jgi:hypothetical protein
MDVDEDLHYRQVKKHQKRKKRFLEDEEEKGSSSKRKKDGKEKSFLEKCKEVGRIGPEVTKLHLEPNQA